MSVDSMTSRRSFADRGCPPASTTLPTSLQVSPTFLKNNFASCSAIARAISSNFASSRGPMRSGTSSNLISNLASIFSGAPSAAGAPIRSYLMSCPSRCVKRLTCARIGSRLFERCCSLIRNSFSNSDFNSGKSGSIPNRIPRARSKSRANRLFWRCSRGCRFRPR